MSSPQFPSDSKVGGFRRCHWLPLLVIYWEYDPLLYTRGNPKDIHGLLPIRYLALSETLHQHILERMLACRLESEYTIMLTLPHDAAQLVQSISHFARNPTPLRTVLI